MKPSSQVFCVNLFRFGVKVAFFLTECGEWGLPVSYLLACNIMHLCGVSC
jgi:hypothetical protein